MTNVSSPPRSRKSRKHSQTKRDSTLSQMLATPNGRAMLAVSIRAEVTAADAVAPPGSVLENVVANLRQHTDLPPLLGIGTVMALVSAALVQAGSTVQWPDDPHRIELDQWIVVLAPSGAGKSFVRSTIQSALNLQIDTLDEPASGPAYLNAMAAAGGRSFWNRDEYGQLIKSTAEGGRREDMRDLLLRTYDHDDLVHTTVTRGKTHVASPVLTILGTSVDSTWGNCVDATMLADGFAARHLYLVAEARPMAVPRYPRAAMVASIRRAAGDLGERIMTPQKYEISPEADAVYHDLWRQLVTELDGTLDAAYVRRITWAAARYAVAYHLLLGREGTRIGVIPMRWAWRMVMLHCYSARLVLGIADRSLAGRIERIGAWVDQQRQAGVDVHATGFARRVIQRFKRDLNNVYEARQIVSLVAGGS